MTLGVLAQTSCVNYSVAVTEQKHRIPGDINADGTCDRLDLVMMHQYLMTEGTLTAEEGAVADMNQDGRLNAADLTMLKHILLQNE